MGKHQSLRTFISALSLHKSIGGSIIQTLGTVLGEDDYNKDDEMPELSEIGDIGEILLLVRFPLQVNERKVSEVSSQDVVFDNAASGVSGNKNFSIY